MLVPVKKCIRDTTFRLRSAPPADCAGRALAALSHIRPDAQKIAGRSSLQLRGIHRTWSVSLSVAVGSKPCGGAVPRRRRVDVDGLREKSPPTPPAVDVAFVTVTPQAATVTEDYVAQTEAINTVESPPCRRRAGSSCPTKANASRSANCCSSSPAALHRRAVPGQAALGRPGSAGAVAARPRPRQVAVRNRRRQPQELDAAVAKNDANLASSTPAAGVRTAELNLATPPSAAHRGIMGRAQLRLGGLVRPTHLRPRCTDRPHLHHFSMRAAHAEHAAPWPGGEPGLHQCAAVPHLPADGSSTRRSRASLHRSGGRPAHRHPGERLEVDNPDHLLHAGQFARVQVAAAVLTMPSCCRSAPSSPAGQEYV